MNASDPFGLVGQVLDGQFRVDKLVGEGGFSAVYRGHHQGLNEPIAVKCLKLPAALGTSLVDTFVQRFRDESRILYRLSQGNLHVVRSIAAGTTQAPATGALVPYMVLEWLEGRSVQNDFIVRRTIGEKGRSIEEVVKLFETAADGLAYAHTQGVVHRDLNPGNLFLANTQHGVKMKVLDFGVAKLMHDGALNLGPRAQTVGQIKIFAPAYGAPEQFDDRIGNVGAPSDVYSFALILLEALRDKSVVEGTHLGEFAQSTTNPERRPTPRMLGIDVPDEVEQAFARATTLDPVQRWRTAGDFWQSLTIALKFAIERKYETAARETPPLAMGGPPPAAPPAPVAAAAPPAAPAAPAAPAGPVPGAGIAAKGNLGRTLALGSSTPSPLGFPRPAPGAAPRPTGSRVPTTIGIPGPAGGARPGTPAPFARPGTPATFAAQGSPPAGAPLPPSPLAPAPQPGSLTTGAPGALGAPLAPPVAPQRQTARPPSSPRNPSLPSVPPLAPVATAATARFPAPSKDEAMPESGPGSPANPRDLPPMPAMSAFEQEEAEDEATKVHAPAPEILRTLAMHDAANARAAANSAIAAAQAKSREGAPAGAAAADEAASLEAAARDATKHRPAPVTPVPPSLGGTLMMAPMAHAPPPNAAALMQAAQAQHAPPPQAAHAKGGLGGTVAMVIPKTHTPGLPFSPPQPPQPPQPPPPPVESAPQVTEPMHMVHMQGIRGGTPQAMQPPAPLAYGQVSTLVQPPIQPSQQPPQQQQQQSQQSPQAHSMNPNPAGGGAPFGASSQVHGQQPQLQGPAHAQTPFGQRPPMDQPFPPSSFAQQPGEAAPKSALPIVPIAIGLAVLALGGIGLGFFALRARHAAATDPTGTMPSDMASGAESLTPVPVPVPVDTTPAPSASAAAPAESAAPAVADETDAATTAAAASASASAATTTNTPPPTPGPQFTWPPPATATPTPPPPKPSADPNAFNEGAARSGLSRASGMLAFCKKEGGVTGPGNASVTFAIDGSVAGVAFDPPYAGTTEGNCVAGQFRRAKVSPFTGAPQTVRVSFEVPK